jgi:hypothetical protein
VSVLAVTTDYDSWATVIAGYVIVFGSIGAFAWRIIARGRKLARQVPDDQKPWV